MVNKRTYLVKIVIGILLGYAILFLLANLFFSFIFPKITNFLGADISKNTLEILPVFIVSFVLTFAVLIYLFNSLLERKWVPIKWPDIILFMGVTAALGPTMEVAINSFARFFFDNGIWVYQLLPVHGGDTSIVGTIIWPLYGFHIYCFHAALKARHDITENIDLSLFVGIDAIVLEVLANLFALSFFYTYIFFYFAPDLHHLSTALIFIPYVLSGYLGIRVLRVLEKGHHRIFWGVLGFIWNLTFIFIL